MLLAHRSDSAPTAPQLRVDDIEVPVHQIVIEPKALAWTRRLTLFFTMSGRSF